MIGKYVEYSIHCDVCMMGTAYSALDWGEETRENFDRRPLDGFENRRELIETAKKEGWKIKRNRHICPKCRKTKKEGDAQK